MDERITQIQELIDEIVSDNQMPKNVREKLSRVTNVLKEDTELSLKTTKALDILDELCNDSNLQAYIRTQLWNIASVLESIRP